MALDYKNFAILYEDGIDDMVSKLNASGTFDGEKLRLQADCHVGKGCAVGTCLTYTDKIAPSLVGCDIACRVSAFNLGFSIDEDALKAIDEAIYERVPSGFDIRAVESEESCDFDYEDLYCWDAIKRKEDRFRKSMGTLGGGNHFIAVERVERGAQAGKYYLMVHCGTRNLGKAVFDYYQGKAIALRDRKCDEICECYRRELEEFKADGRYSEINGLLDRRDKEISDLPEDDLCYLEGDVMWDYLHDMDILCNWSRLNHEVIAGEVMDALGLADTRDWYVSSIHNYVDVEHYIIRKGAISARMGEYGIIPMNMRDGSLIVLGKGNEDYLYSAPHGAGRIMSRARARVELDMTEFRDSMDGIYTTSVNESTIDEAPNAYKAMEDILPAIEPTVEIIERTIPVYNYKAHTI